VEYLNVCNDIVSFFLDAYGWNTLMFVMILVHFSYIFYYVLYVGEDWFNTHIPGYQVLQWVQIIVLV